MQQTIKFLANFVIKQREAYSIYISVEKTDGDTFAIQDARVLQFK